MGNLGMQEILLITIILAIAFFMTYKIGYKKGYKQSKLDMYEQGKIKSI